MLETTSLPALLRQPGVVVGTRAGTPVAVHYGSAAGELAACVRGVGLAARSDLATISLTARTRSLELLTRRLIGHTVHPGGAGTAAGGWWCRAAATGELLVVCPRRVLPRLLRDINRLADGAAVDRCADLAVLGIVGAQATALLARLGVLRAGGDIREVAPFSSAPVAEHDVDWLLETTTQALAVTATARAVAVWSAIEAEGRPLGIARVGLEAVERYRLLERARASGAVIAVHPSTPS
jgi:glycine cleavage system aminomethyltransferase T